MQKFLASLTLIAASISARFNLNPNVYYAVNYQLLLTFKCYDCGGIINSCITCSKINKGQKIFMVDPCQVFEIFRKLPSGYITSTPNNIQTLMKGIMVTTSKEEKQHKIVWMEDDAFYRMSRRNKWRLLYFFLHQYQHPPTNVNHKWTPSYNKHVQCFIHVYHFLPFVRTLNQKNVDIMREII